MSARRRLNYTNTGLLNSASFCCASFLVAALLAQVLEKLAAIVPPPRFNLVCYHGVALKKNSDPDLIPNSKIPN